MCIHTYLMYTYITHHKLIKVKLQHNTMRKIIKKIRQHIHTILLWSPITSISIVCSAVCTGTDQRKHQSSASLAFVRGIHRWPVDSPHRGPVARKMFPFDDVIMNHDIPYAPQQYLYHFYKHVIMGQKCGGGYKPNSSVILPVFFSQFSNYLLPVEITFISNRYRHSLTAAALVTCWNHVHI